MSEKDRMMNGTAAAPEIDPSAVPVGDPNVIRALQHFLAQAQAGAIGGVVIVGLDANGNVQVAPVLPQNPAALHIINGALFGAMRQIDAMLDKFRQPAAASPIIKPNGMFRQQ